MTVYGQILAKKSQFLAFLNRNFVDCGVFKIKDEIIMPIVSNENNYAAETIFDKRG